MEFGKHLSKGIWGLADKGLPVIYGVAYVLLVIRVLPEEEFGSFVLVQEVFLICTGLAIAFALQPLLKFGSERVPNERDVVGATFWLHVAFTAGSAILILLFRSPLARVFNVPQLEELLSYVPLMFVATFMRNETLILLQTRFRTQQVFWVDAAHFLGAPAGIYLSSKMGLFDTARDLIMVNIASLSLSSIVGMILARDLMPRNFLPSWVEMRRMWDYGKYSVSSIVSYMFYSKADSFFLAAFSGPVAVAVYNSVKVFARVYEMVTQVVQMFVVPASSRLAALGDTEGLKKLVEKAITFSTVGMMPVLLSFLLFAPAIVGAIYGDRYGEAIPLLQILSTLCLVVPLTSVASSTLFGLGYARKTFILGSITLVLSAAIYLALVPWLGPLGATLGFVLSSCVQAWIFVRGMAAVVPVTAGGTVGRVGDIVRFVRSRTRRAAG